MKFNLDKFTKVFRDLGLLQRAGISGKKIKNILKSKYRKDNKWANYLM